MQGQRRQRRQRQKHHAGAAAFAAVALVLVILLGGCGQVSNGGGQGTISGDVVAGPTSPVEREGTPSTTPVVNRQVLIKTPGGADVAQTTTDAQGHFTVSVAPGDYVVQVAIVPGTIGLRQQTPGDVKVVAGQTTHITVELDTGIR